MPKDHPLRREEKWEHFLRERVVAGFRCEVKLTMSNRFFVFSLFTSRFCARCSELSLGLGITERLDLLLDLAESTQYQ